MKLSIMRRDENHMTKRMMSMNVNGNPSSGAVRKDGWTM
jgi:hypothetical protein